MVRNTILALVAAIGISSCATTANYEAILETWVGAHADKLVASWGPPQGYYELGSGGKVLEYANQRTASIGGYSYSSPQTTYHSGSASAYGSGGYAYGNYSGTSTTYVTKTTPKYNISMSCKTRFTTNSAGVIVSWAWQGNDCKALSSK